MSSIFADEQCATIAHDEDEPQAIDKQKQAQCYAMEDALFSTTAQHTAFQPGNRLTQELLTARKQRIVPALTSYTSLMMRARTNSATAELQ